METKVVKPESLSTKLVASKTIFYKEGKTTLNSIHEYANREVEALMLEVERGGLEPQGPLEFIYFGASGDMEKEFTLQIALPVKEKKPVKAGYQFRETAPFKCLSYDYKGDVSQMFPAYEMLYQQLEEKQLQPLDEVREVYKQWEHLTSANNITEIQIGIR